MVILTHMYVWLLLHIFTLVPPTQPVLGPIRDMEGCTECIVAQEGHLPDVQCNSTGTFTIIGLQIGSRTSCTLEIDPDGVHTRLTDASPCHIVAKDHGTQLSCLVYNRAVPGGIRSEQKTLYVTGNPLKY